MQQPLTADLCDRHGGLVRSSGSVLRSFGGAARFHGRAVTVRSPEDNGLLESVLLEHGAGRVVVVDGDGSPRCALVGERMMTLAAANGWAGVLVFGAVRDVAAVALLPVGLLALGTHPRRCGRTGSGERDVTVEVGSLEIAPGDLVVVDEDGVVVVPGAVDLVPPW